MQQEAPNASRKAWNPTPGRPTPHVLFAAVAPDDLHAIDADGDPRLTQRPLQAAVTDVLFGFLLVVGD
jgi:hypothetical protein